ncbi:MAG: hypothetical protein IJF69_01345, partial [Clostridia bacterium]|nr:hypothetical protein [Clostridia bacterium]
GISQFELWLVSVTPEITGNIVLNVGGETFTVPVTGEVTKVVLCCVLLPLRSAIPIFEVFWRAEPFFQKRFCIPLLLPDKP